jgi:hypothetical protein
MGFVVAAPTGSNAVAEQPIMPEQFIMHLQGMWRFRCDVG